MDTPSAPAADPPPSAAPHRGFDRRAYRDPRPSAALIRAVGWLNRLLVLPHLVRLASFDLPRADLERLRAAVRPGTAAFLGPNHPEFFTDWMIDKELSSRVSPLMAHWASYEIVNVNPLAQWLWLRNNLIANVPGGGGREYSIRWAIAGHGVLLHPEGTASWHGERVGPLIPGIVDLAWETCARARAAGRDLPVFVVPIVWRLHFAGDVSSGLAREMAHMERALELPPGERLPVEERFAALQANLLRRQCETLGLPAPFVPAGPARRGLLRRAGRGRAGHRPASWSRAARAWSTTSPASCTAPAGRPAPGPSGPERERDRQLYLELWRLEGFPRALYDTPTLTQEAIAENLKRIRSVFVTRGRGDALHNVVPVPVGRRIAHVRVPEPIAVHAAFAAGGDAGAAKTRLLETLHARLQGSLDALNAELAPLLARARRPNPLWTGRAPAHERGDRPEPVSRAVDAPRTPPYSSLHASRPHRGRAPGAAARPSPAAWATCSLGSAHPVVVQSMTNTDTADAAATAAPGRGARRAPARELVRVTVNTREAAAAVPEIAGASTTRGVRVPLIGDFHYNGHLLLTEYPECAARARQVPHQPRQRGRGKRHDENFRAHHRGGGRARQAGAHRRELGLARPARCSPSLMDANAQRREPRPDHEVMLEAMLESALRSAELAERCGLPHDRIILSAKVSRCRTWSRSTARSARACDYPLHLGLTEAGPGMKGIVASAAALSILLAEGIGDTIRASLTPTPGGDRAEEVRVCQQILQSLGIRRFAPQVTACPGCGRTTSTFFQELAAGITAHIQRTHAALARVATPASRSCGSR